MAKKKVATEVAEEMPKLNTESTTAETPIEAPKDVPADPQLPKVTGFMVDFPAVPGLEELAQKSTPPPVVEKAHDLSKLSTQERIVEFLRSRGTGQFIRINDFLKSLYPLPKNNEPVEWQKQTAMKSLKAILDGMVVKRDILVSNNSYLLLGKAYWPDDTTGVTHYHHLGTVNIEAKLA